MEETRQKGILLVLLAGAGTSILALAGIWTATKAFPDFYIMGWYLWFIIPLGAILVGGVAGSGYGIVSWIRGVKIGGLLMVAVVTLQVAVYFRAQYQQYEEIDPVYEDGSSVGFWTFFDFETRNITFKKRRSDEPGEPLGAMGYLFRGLEILGFAAGGLIAPLILRAKPFCERCQVYMKTRNQGLLPAGIIPRKVKKKDTEGRATMEKEAREAMEAGMASLQGILEAATAGDPAGYRDRLAEHVPRRKETGKLSARIRVDLAHCPGCSNGLLKAALVSGQGENVKSEDIGITPLDPQFVKGCLDGS